MHEKPQPEGKPLLVTMATRQPGEGKGKDGGWGAAEAGDGGMTYMTYVFFSIDPYHDETVVLCCSC